MTLIRFRFASRLLHAVKKIGMDVNTPAPWLLELLRKNFSRAPADKLSKRDLATLKRARADCGEHWADFERAGREHERNVRKGIVSIDAGLLAGSPATSQQDRASEADADVKGSPPLSLPGATAFPSAFAGDLMSPGTKAMVSAPPVPHGASPGEFVAPQGPLRSPDPAPFARRLHVSDAIGRNSHVDGEQDDMESQQPPPSAVSKQPAAAAPARLPRARRGSGAHRVPFPSADTVTRLPIAAPGAVLGPDFGCCAPAVLAPSEMSSRSAPAEFSAVAVRLSEAPTAASDVFVEEEHDEEEALSAVALPAVVDQAPAAVALPSYVIDLQSVSGDVYLSTSQAVNLAVSAPAQAPQAPLVRHANSVSRLHVPRSQAVAAVIQPPAAPLPPATLRPPAPVRPSLGMYAADTQSSRIRRAAPPAPAPFASLATFLRPSSASRDEFVCSIPFPSLPPTPVPERSPLTDDLAQRALERARLHAAPPQEAVPSVSASAAASQLQQEVADAECRARAASRQRARTAELATKTTFAAIPAFRERTTALPAATAAGRAVSRATAATSRQTIVDVDAPHALLPGQHAMEAAAAALLLPASRQPLPLLAHQQAVDAREAALPLLAHQQPLKPSVASRASQGQSLAPSHPLPITPTVPSAEESRKGESPLQVNARSLRSDAAAVANVYLCIPPACISGCSLPSASTHEVDNIELCGCTCHHAHAQAGLERVVTESQPNVANPAVPVPSRRASAPSVALARDIHRRLLQPRAAPSILAHAAIAKSAAAASVLSVPTDLTQPLQPPVKPIDAPWFGSEAHRAIAALCEASASVTAAVNRLRSGSSSCYAPAAVVQPPRQRCDRAVGGAKASRPGIDRGRSRLPHPAPRRSLPPRPAYVLAKAKTPVHEAWTACRLASSSADSSRVKRPVSVASAHLEIARFAVLLATALPVSVPLALVESPAPSAFAASVAGLSTVRMLQPQQSRWEAGAFLTKALPAVGLHPELLHLRSALDDMGSRVHRLALHGVGLSRRSKEAAASPSEEDA